MDLTGFLKRMTKFQCTCISVDNDCNAWAQPIAIAQALVDAGIKLLQILDHLPNRAALHRNRPLPVRETAQQRRNADDWQRLILCAAEAQRQFSPASSEECSYECQSHDRWRWQPQQEAGRSELLRRRARHTDARGWALPR